MSVGDKVDDPTNLGNVLINMGILTPEVLTQALQERESMDLLIGRVLVARGYISEGDLQKALDLQVELRHKDKFRRAMAVSQVAQETNVRIVDLATAIGTKMASVRAHCATKKRNGTHR